MSDMTVSEMRECKARVEQAINTFVLEQIDTFTRESGLLVTKVDIKLMAFTSPINGTQIASEGTSMTVLIPPPEGE